MADLDGLKKRVELIDLRLKTAHSARERESTALMATWEQIRSRFQDQSAEIIKLRSQISDLEDSRDDLLKMVHSLLSAVEGGLDSMADETVPQIKMMAGQLLSNNGIESQPASTAAKSVGSENDPSADTASNPAMSSTGTSFHDDLLTAIEQTIESVEVEKLTDKVSLTTNAETFVETGISEPASPGIRDLVTRIENAVGEDLIEPPSTDDNNNTDADDDLTRDLREIEALRGELHGLRQRISNGAL